MKPTVLNTAITKLITPRLKDEMMAFYAYRAISNWARGTGFMKAGDYFSKESDDELSHAKRIEQYLVDWNVIPELPVIEQPKLEFRSLIEAIEFAYNIELNLYTAYDEVCSKAFELDTAAYEFLSEYLKIQTKSVAEYSDMLNVLEGFDTGDKFQMVMVEEKLFS